MGLNDPTSPPNPWMIDPSNNSWAKGLNPGGPGSGSGSGSSADDKARTTLDLLYEIAISNKDALNDKFNHSMDMYNVSDEQARKLADTQSTQNKRNVGDDWFKQTKKAQNTTQQLKNTSGDALAGSNMYQFMDLIDTAYDDINTEALATQRKNQNTIDNDLFEALSVNVNARNEAALDTEYGLWQIANDYRAQRASMLPDEAKGDKWNEADTWARGFYDNHKTGAAQINDQGFYRGDNNQSETNKLTGKARANASSVNGDYWNSLFNGYNKRY